MKIYFGIIDTPALEALHARLSTETTILANVYSRVEYVRLVMAIDIVFRPHGHLGFDVALNSHAMLIGWIKQDRAARVLRGEQPE